MKNKEFSRGEVFNYNNEIEYADSAIVSKNVIKKNTGNISLFAFDKGENLSEHTAPFDALVHIIDGKAEILIDKNPFVLENGDSIIMPANVPHAVIAKEKFKMLLTMIKEENIVEIN